MIFECVDCQTANYHLSDQEKNDKQASYSSKHVVETRTNSSQQSQIKVSLKDNLLRCCTVRISQSIWLFNELKETLVAVVTVLRSIWLPNVILFVKLCVSELQNSFRMHTWCERDLFVVRAFFNLFSQRLASTHLVKL